MRNSQTDHLTFLKYVDVDIFSFQYHLILDMACMWVSSPAGGSSVGAPRLSSLSASTQADSGCAWDQVNEWICCTAAHCPPCWCGAAEHHSGPTLLQSYKSPTVRPGPNRTATAGDGQEHWEKQRKKWGKTATTGGEGVAWDENVSTALCSPPPMST